MKFTYTNSAGKKLTKDAANDCLASGRAVTVSNGNAGIKLDQSGGYYVGACDKHNSKCEMKTTGRAISWAEEHLRQHHC